MSAFVRHLAEIERRVLWLATWMIHHAKHVREADETKVGRHQASSASMATIMTVLYLGASRTEGRFAVKAHALPIYHALRYLSGNQTREKVEWFRGYGGVQSYPSRTKDTDDVDISIGSVGLGVGQTLFFPSPKIM
jgi:pyruvate dehydrogenase E1 component